MRGRRGHLLLVFAAATVLVTAALAVPAAQAVTWVVKGRGFGHGVGMSQYGAYGYARAGKGYRQILRHYYTGTQVSSLERTRVVRVLLDINQGDVGFTGAKSACGRRLNPAGRFQAHRFRNFVVLRTETGKPMKRCGGKLRAAGGGRIRIGREGIYHGALEVVPTRSDRSALNVINAVSVNQYVKGVIPNEMPASWPRAALRAQAVAARSYALSTQVDGNGFGLYDTTASQVYEGIGSEAASSNRAAMDTKGEVVTYNGTIAQTYFMASSGGRTESVENSFYGPPIPYLKSVRDPYDYYSPLHKWTLRFSAAQMNAKLGSYLRGRLQRIVVTQRGDSPRIVWARLYGTGGMTKIRGDQLQYALGAYDRWMYFRKVAGRARRSAVGVGLKRDPVIGLSHAELVRPAPAQAELPGRMADALDR
jgi:stage II sporulation protein D